MDRVPSSPGGELRRDPLDPVSGISEIVFSVDMEGRWLSLNDAFTRGSGVPVEQVIGMKAVDFIPEPDREAHVAAFSPLFRGRQERVTTTHRVPLADGSLRWVETRARLVRDAAGEPAGIVGTIVDATDQHAREEEERALAAGLRAVHQAMHAVLASDDPRSAVCRAAREVGEAPFAVLMERVGDELVLAGASGVGVEGVRVPLHGDTPSIARAVLLAGAPRWLPDARCSDEVLPTVRKWIDARSMLFHPIGEGADLRGVLILAWDQVREPLPTHRAEAVRVLADQAALAIQRGDLVDELRDRARNDSLTGVANRAAFDDVLGRELVRARRTGEPLTVMAIDVNRFKEVNDTRGHAAGDALLIAATRAWSQELRGTDVLARIGGDEFAIVLPACDAEQAVRVADRLRAVVVHDAGFGIGAATWDGVEDAGRLLARADRALYSDKASRLAGRVTEPARLDAVAAARRGAEAVASELDRMSETVAELLGVPLAFISLVGSDELLFAGHHGLPFPDGVHPVVPLEHSFCKHTVALGRALLIPDAREHPLVADSMLVEHMGVVAYAGVPLLDEEGNVLGATCAVDRKPRAWTTDELATIRTVARRAAAALQASDAGAIVTP